TPLESMACGTPVIGSRVGGIKYTVLDGKTGFLVEPHEPRQLADRLHALLTDPQLARAMRMQSLQRVNSLFTWKQACQSLAAVYEELWSERELAVPAVDLLAVPDKSRATKRAAS